MKTSFKKIYLILFCVLCSTANAQYADVIEFRSAEYFLMNKIIFKNVYERNAEIMKGSIKKVKVKDEGNNLLSETFVDINGRVSGYKKYAPGNSVPDVNIKANYDVKNNLTGIFYFLPNGVMTDDIRFHYIGSTLFSYDYFEKDGALYEQSEMRYDKEDKSILTGFDSHFWQGDSIPYSVSFRYDEYGRLNDVRVVHDVEAIYEIKHSGDSLKIISGNGSGYETYLLKENIILKHIIHSEELSFTAERIFSYDENGLINFILIKDSRGNKYRQSFEYDYYH